MPSARRNALGDQLSRSAKKYELQIRRRGAKYIAVRSPECGAGQHESSVCVFCFVNASHESTEPTGPVSIGERNP